MLRMKLQHPKANIINGVSNSSSPLKAANIHGHVHSTAGFEDSGLDIRPCGMFVQKRNSDHYNYNNNNSNHVPDIKVRVKYGSSYHEVIISSQASFGELKKILSGITGLHTRDQKLMYKEKERDSKSFLDACGVRHGSKIVLAKDESSRERRVLESRKNAELGKASKEIADIRSEIDKLAKQVRSIEMEINGGKKVVDMVLLNLIEALMPQLLKLDGIDADGDVKLQRRMQVNRVQKYMETLDMLKIRNSEVGNVVSLQHQREILKGQMPINCCQNRQEQRKQHDDQYYFNPGSVVVTTKWETF